MAKLILLALTGALIVNPPAAGRIGAGLFLSCSSVRERQVNVISYHEIQTGRKDHMIMIMIKSMINTVSIAAYQ